MLYKLCSFAINTKLVALALGGGLAFVAGFFSSRSEESAYAASAQEPILSSSVVNATSSDGFGGEDGLNRASPQRDIQDLREKLTTLEAEIAALKHRGRMPERESSSAHAPTP